MLFIFIYEEIFRSIMERRGFFNPTTDYYCIFIWNIFGGFIFYYDAKTMRNTENERIELQIPQYKK